MKSASMAASRSMRAARRARSRRGAHSARTLRAATSAKISAMQIIMAAWRRRKLKINGEIMRQPKKMISAAARRAARVAAWHENQQLEAAWRQAIARRAALAKA